MRVIAGSAKGKRLVPPKGTDTRPTLDRVREALFSILMPRLAEARFLDLFAGTGANGIEALSRAAAHATFVDSEGRCIRAIEANLASTGLVRDARCLHGQLPASLRLLAGQYDIVLADPPYTFTDYAALLAGLEAGELVAEEGLFVLEHPSKASVPTEGDRLVQTRQARYGRTTLTFYA